MQRRSALSELHMDGPHTEKTHIAKLELTAGLKNWCRLQKNREVYDQ